MITLKATNLRQQATYKDSIYSSAIFSGNKQNPYTVQLWIEAMSNTQVSLICQEHKD